MDLFDYATKFGRTQDFTLTHDSLDYEESLMKYMEYKHKSPFFRGFIKPFGDIKFAEIGNSSLSDFGMEFLKKY